MSMHAIDQCPHCKHRFAFLDNHLRHCRARIDVDAAERAKFDRLIRRVMEETLGRKLD